MLSVNIIQDQQDHYQIPNRRYYIDEMFGKTAYEIRWSEMVKYKINKLIKTTDPMKCALR
jgi:hypothetical protein